jgi:hypothetical protein
LQLREGTLRKEVPDTVTVVPPEGAPWAGNTDVTVEKGRIDRETEELEKSTALLETSTLTAPVSI